MIVRFRDKYERHSISFNVTPLIDIVFLLIVFFVVVFQFIGPDNSAVQLPRKCDQARPETSNQAWPAIITISPSSDRESAYAVNGQLISSKDKVDLLDSMTHLLDKRFDDLPQCERVVVLRIDKDTRFADAQFALAAAAQSQAHSLKLATLANSQKENNNPPDN